MNFTLIVEEQMQSKSFCPSLLSPVMLPSVEKCGDVTAWYGGNTFNYGVNNNLCEPLKCTGSDFQVDKTTGYTIHTTILPGLCLGCMANPNSDI